ncbi:uracil-DNA glycosylase family protein [Proteiniclasticum ruminis]|uniref:Uracil DNA glycosylase superfamily protein n=1 Tax=Proteiniclasticum ruminis TaxID=398199 RepID=A0A1G8LPL1_9CLOT|nr:uracil-DNA glycosylase family protein [Proteiniclasticum ruminis]SDI57628.1 Uracil DNA glycosylase superfamily protein [Proteiniclasticum ruminis]
MNSPYEGCYITDLIKNHPDKNSKSVIAHIKNHPETLTNNIETLRRELSYFKQKPIVIALGKDVYRLLEPLYKEFKVVKVSHYSYIQGLEKYKKEIEDAIESVK